MGLSVLRMAAEKVGWTAPVDERLPRIKPH